MSWEVKDHQRQRGRGTSTARPIAEASPLPEAVPPTDQEPDMLPTVVEMLSWDAAADDGMADGLISRDDARELAEMGMMTDRQWAQWCRIARRGAQEV